MKTVHGLRIAEDGTVTEVTLKSLEGYQAAVGGLIECVQFEGGDMYVNEEGLLIGLSPNFRASCIAGFVVVGPAIILGPCDDEGNNTSILPEWRDAILRGTV